jgi:hypothetical protein
MRCFAAPEVNTMPDAAAAVSMLSESDWDSLISRIKNGKCTPFLGAGMSSEKIPLGAKIAQQLSQTPHFNYPLKDSGDLIKVAQYIALMADASRPKELVAQIIKDAGYPDFQKADEPHMALASMPLSLYMTTNYDDFMFQALKKTAGKEPKLFINRWYDPDNKLKGEPGVPDEGAVSELNPSESKPAVYYFHGHKDNLDTMVLTEDDYLDFLVRVSRDQTLIPPRIQEAIGGTSLLFIGYGLNDTNFRVIFRGLVENRWNTRKFSVTVQLRPGEPGAVEYLTKYFGSFGIRVYWGGAREFVNELKKRWDAAK